MCYKIFDTAISEYIKSYQTIVGNSYDENMFPAPASVSEDLFEIVKAIKILRLEQRWLEIIQELRDGQLAGEVVVVPGEKKHLLEEVDSIRNEIEKWVSYRR